MRLISQGGEKKRFFRSVDEKAHVSRTVEQKNTSTQVPCSVYIFFLIRGIGTLARMDSDAYNRFSLFLRKSDIFRPRFPWKKFNRKNETAELFSIVFIFFPGKPRVVRAEKIKNSASRGKKNCAKLFPRGGKFSGGTFCGKWSRRRRRTYLPFPQQEKKEIDILRHLRLQCREEGKWNCLGGKNGGEGLHSISHTGETENKHGKRKGKGKKQHAISPGGASLPPHAATYQQSRREGGRRKGEKRKSLQLK